MKLSIYNYVLVVVASFFIMASCEDELIGPERANTQTENFQYFWKKFDTHYGLFDVKKINWDSVYQLFRPKVSDTMSNEALYKVLSDMVVLLNDNHVNIYPTNGTLPVFPGGVLRYSNDILTIKKIQEDYDLEVVKKYLKEYHEATWNIRYGKLPGNIGYLNISGTDKRNVVKKKMEKVINELDETRAMIVDVRACYGGDDAITQLLAGYFTDEKKLYMTTRKRNGPKHSDFTDAVAWYVSPSTPKPYTKPVIVLTSNFTQSTGETFLLAMNELEHVTLVGDTTAGSFSDNPTMEMPNGWMFSFSVGDFRAANGRSYEGIGVIPDVAIVNTKEDLLSFKDRTIEKAMELLK